MNIPSVSVIQAVTITFGKNRARQGEYTQAQVKKAAIEMGVTPKQAKKFLTQGVKVENGKIVKGGSPRE